jgi:hypothetical protein
MKISALIVSAIAIAVVVASPAEAAGKHKKTVAGHATVQRSVAMNSGFQGGVRAGPLYNGQDYIGDDPDPNIRAALIKDMTRYQGSY